MKSIDPLDPRFVKAMARPQRLGYSSASSKPSALADRATRAAEEQDAYGLSSPVLTERIADEDRTCTGGFLNEEVVDAIRTGRSRNSAVAEAARAFNTPWLLDEAAMPRE